MTVSAQTLGPLGVPVYASTAQLALETGAVPGGMVVAVESPFQILQALVSAPANNQYVVSSTAASLYGGQVTYWAPLNGLTSISAQSTPFVCRAAPLTLAAYAGSGTGVLTASATGAIGSADGVSVVAGDQIFLIPGLTHVTAVDSGPWVIVNAGASGVKYVLARPSWFTHAALWQCGQQVKIGGEGAFMQNTVWRVTGTPGAITFTGAIDAVDPGFWCERFSFERKLVAGTLVLAAGQPAAAATSATMPIGIYSATQSNVLVELAVANGTLTGTVSYGPSNSASTSICTGGYTGTSAGAVFALATAQTTQTNDTSTVQVTVVNF